MTDTDDVKKPLTDGEKLVRIAAILELALSGQTDHRYPGDAVALANAAYERICLQRHQIAAIRKAVGDQGFDR